MPGYGKTLNICIGFTAWCCWCLALFSLPTVVAGERNSEDSLLKAAFIYNFAKFTHWPQESWDAPNTPLNLCTMGNDALVSNLSRLSKETVAGHPVSINTFDPGVEDSDCHILYIATSEHKHFTRFIQQTHDAPVMTISEIPGFAGSGGIIQLYREQQQIRFKINLGVARDRGLTLSARLLDLAELVDTKVTP